MNTMRAMCLLAVFVLTASWLASGQYVAVSGNCELPGQAVVVSGLVQAGTQPLSGSPFTTGSGVMASYPQCLVTVYPAGSATPVPTGNIYSTSSGAALGNPFTANTDGAWTFYAASSCYDVVLSSGTGPANQLPATKTLSGKCAGLGNASGNIHGLSFTIGAPGGTALTAGANTTDYLTIPFACVIQAYNLAIDAGTITVKFWKIATGTAIPTSSNSISTSGESISTGTAIHSATLTDFTTTTVNQNDIVAMNVSTVSGAAYVNGVLQCQ